MKGLIFLLKTSFKTSLNFDFNKMQLLSYIFIDYRKWSNKPPLPNKPPWGLIRIHSGCFSFFSCNFSNEMIDTAPLETIVDEYEEGEWYWDRLVFAFITFRKICCVYVVLKSLFLLFCTL